ncbi:hypothetical protein HPB49_015454 [Dermacentor silvarum]|uniref:Uncharacterized protein n=1 Tax=Dermacentor silvarum TaxID=543639 RepID=A0ACB8DED6_DERSI|nr:hypothetical protein HPB49_015454 [Dermacentor silvarum]
MASHFWEYTLTGFSDFLERRCIAFAEPMATTRVCGVCGLVPYSSLLLPCGHVLCQLCKDQNATETDCCPFDGRKFTDADSVLLTFKQSDLVQHRVFCVAGGQECSFAGKLSELRDHLVQCDRDLVKCAKCRQRLIRTVAVDHCRRCGDKTAPRQSDLLDTRINSGGNQQLNPAVQAKAVVTPGPYRAASKPGVFITTCEFPDVYSAHDSLIEDRKEHTLSSDTYTLAGYTSCLDCVFSKDESEEIGVCFILFLRDGPWDGHLEWPFSKKVTVTITHPRDKSKDVRLASGMERQRAPNGKKSWNDIELQGFIDKNTLFANVEFE